MKVRHSKYFFRKWLNVVKQSDIELFIPYCKGMVKKSYMSTWYSKSTGFYLKFSTTYPRCYENKDKKMKTLTYNSNHHLLVKVETVYVLG